MTEEDVLHVLQRIEQKVDRNYHLIKAVLKEGEILMALADDLKVSIAKLDAETTAIAGVIADLASRVHNSMTDAEVADVKGSLTALSDKLTTLGVDPTNPVPNPTPGVTKPKKP